MNDRNDDQFEHEDTPGVDESGDSSESQNESLEDLIDKMAIADGISLTYGEYRKIEQDPEHPIRNPEHPQHGDYLEAKKTMEGIGETLRVSLEGLYPKIDLWEKNKPQVPTFDWMKSVVPDPELPLDRNSHLDAIESIREHEESMRRAIEEQMEEFEAEKARKWAEKARKEEEERAYKERMQFAVMNLLESQKQTVETNAKNREADKKEQEERDRIEEERSNRNFNLGVATLITAVVTFFATLLGLFIR